MKRIIGLALALLAVGPLVCSTGAFAEESMTNQVKDSVGEGKVATKKMVRKGKRKIRNATGNESVGKDIRDMGSDVKDDVTNTVEKVKRK